MKEPRNMTPGQINSELESLHRKRHSLVLQFIKEGRGDERLTDYQHKTDPLSRKMNAITDRIGDLRNEIEHRAGPGVHRMPTGRMFGPRKERA